jgi:hypothetical protein
MRVLVAWLSAAAFVGLGVAAASARPPTPPVPTLKAEARPSRQLPAPGGFKLQSSNGYSIVVFGAPARRGRPAAVLIFVGGKRGSASYFAPARVTRTSIEAGLGDLGHIAVSFQPSGKSRTERSQCGGRSVSFDSGDYAGTIDFHGEEGYTDVEATRARGDLKFLLDAICPAPGTSGIGPGLPGAELRVRPIGSQSGPSLSLIENDPRAPVRLEASIEERRGEISIERSTAMTAPRTAFDYDSPLRTATVRPPAPFSGEATFRRTAKTRNRWTGNLTVDLPGRSGVFLTGKGLRANLFHAWMKGSGPIE